MHGAQEVDEQTAPELVHIVTDLAHRAGLPMPRVYVMDNPQPNAFATERNAAHAAVAATTGLLDMLSPDELAGVISRELAHVRNRDALLMMVTATIASTITMVAQFGMLFGGGHRDRERNGRIDAIGRASDVIMAPLAAMLLQMAISRTREYAADDRGMRLCGNPHWPKSTRPHSRSRTFRPNRTQQRHICSSSIRCLGRAWTIRSLPVHRPKIASPPWSDSRRRWA